MTAISTMTKHLALSTGESVFYREAGSVTAPTILLLHGFPSSSHQFRKLIPLLSSHYHVLAPDLPSYGFTTVPADYVYTFDNIADTINTFLSEVPSRPKSYSIYVFDYGAPTGFRLALKHPDKVQAIITQNGNAYKEGFGADFWKPIFDLWASENSASARATVKPALALDGTKSQYFTGEPDSSTIAPESYTLDQAGLDRPGNDDVQLDLFYDYRTNVEKYPEWQAWLKESQIPLLAAWGKNDVIFVKEGAEAFKRDLPKAEIHLLDAGHFVSETHPEVLGTLIVEFLSRHGI